MANRGSIYRTNSLVARAKSRAKIATAKRLVTEKVGSATVAPKALEKDQNRGGLLGGIGYAAEKLGLGFVQGVEGAADFVVGGLADMFGADDFAEDVFDDDWLDYGHADEWYNPDDTMRVVGDVAGAIGTTLPTVGVAVGSAALTYATGGAAAPVAIKALAATAAPLVAGLSAAGNATKEAYRETGKLTGEEYAYGALVGATEAGVEMLSKGLMKGSGRLVGGILKKGAGETVKSASRGGAKAIGKALLEDMASEAIEEGIATAVAPVYARATYNPNAENATLKEIGYDAFIGAMSGLVLGGVGQVGGYASDVRAGKKVAKNGGAEELVKRSAHGLSALRADVEAWNQVQERVASDPDMGRIEKFRTKRKIGKSAERISAAADAVAESLARWNELSDAERGTSKGLSVLGALSKNKTLLDANRWVGARAEALASQDDATLESLVEQVREATGITYTLEELRADKDDVLSRIAANELVISEVEYLKHGKQMAATGTGNADADVDVNEAGSPHTSSAETGGMTSSAPTIEDFARDTGIVAETGEDLTAGVPNGSVSQMGVQKENAAGGVFEGQAEATAEDTIRKVARERGLSESETRAMTETYRLDGASELDAKEYAERFAMVAKMGRDGAVESAIDADEYLSKLPESSRRVAYKAGQTARTEQAATSAQVKYSSEESTQIMYSSEESVDQGLLEFYRSVTSMKQKNLQSKRKKKIGKISKTHAHLIAEAIKKETGKTIDVSGYDLYIDGSTIQHIEDRHGQKGTADRSMADPKDVARIGWAANNAQEAEVLKNADGSYDLDYNFKSRNNEPSYKVKLSQKIDGGEFFVVECVPDSESKRLYVKSAYIQKNSGTGTELNMDPNGSPQHTPKAQQHSNTANNSIPQPSPVVNRKNTEISRPSLRPGRVLRAEGVNIHKFSDAQYATYKAAEIMARALGTDIVIHENLGKTKDGKIINGYFDPTDGSIHININAMRDGKQIALYTLAHEVTHYIKAWSPAKYAELERFVMEQLGADAEAKVEAKLEQLKKNKLIPENTTDANAEALAREEVVADGMEGVLDDGEVLGALARDNRTLFEKIKDVVTAAIAKVKAAFGELNKHSQTAKVLADTVDSLETLKQLFYEAASDAGKNRRRAGAEGLTRMNSGKMQVGGDPNADYADYDKPITMQDIEVLRSIGRKTINQFTSEEIKKARKWAHKFYKELGVKSPFFRAWFGDWRAYDTSPIEVVHVDKSAELKSGKCQNSDMQRVISWSPEAAKESILNAPKDAKSDIALIASNLPKLVENAVLLDTSISEKSSKRKLEGTAFMHSLYAVVQVDSRQIVVKMYTEEAMSPKSREIFSRAYSLKYIEKVAEFDNGVHLDTESLTESPPATINSIADLYALVKQFDKDFSPTPEVSQHVLNADGTPKVFYHGTDAEFTAFEPDEMAHREGSFFFAENREDAEAYGKNVFEVYLTGRNLANYDDQPSEFYRLRNKREQVAWLKERGYDGWYADMDSGGWGELSVFSPEQIKSATDNIGTFDGTNPDIRYSYESGDTSVDADVSEGKSEGASPSPTNVEAEVQNEAVARVEKAEAAAEKDLKAENAKLREDVEHLKELLKLQRTVTDGTTFTKASMSRAASRIMKVIGATKGKTQLLEQISQLYAEIATAEQVDMEDIMSRAEEIAEELIDEQPGTRVPGDPEYAEILDYLRSTSFSLTDVQKQEAAYRYGSYESFRRRMMGKLKIKKNAASLDVIWGELCELYPGIFSTEMNEADMVEAIVQIRHDAVINQTAFAYIDKDAAISDVARTIYDGYWDAVPVHTLADEHRREVSLLKAKHARVTEEIRASADRRVAAMRESLKEQNRRVREQRDEAVRKERERADARIEGWRERRQETKDRHAVRRATSRLYKRLLSPTKERNVPESLRAAVAEALGAMKLDARVMDQIADIEAEIEKLERQDAPDLDKIAKLESKLYKLEENAATLKEQSEAILRAYEAAAKEKDSPLADEIVEKLRELQAEIGESPVGIYDMDRKQLRAARDFYEMILHQVTNANKMLAADRQATVDKNGTAAMIEMSESKAPKFLKPRAGEARSMVTLRKYLWQMLKPINAVEMLGSDTLSHAFANLHRGEGVCSVDLAEAQEKFQAEAETYHFWDWDRASRREFKTANGKTVKLTLGQMMSLYAYSKRENAHQHLREGGFTFAPDATYKGKITERMLQDSERYTLTEAEFGKIASALTEEQRAFADAMQEYLSKDMAAKGNEVSVKLYGIKLFGEANYWPMRSAREYLDSETGKTGDPKIKNKGFTKKVTPNAGNPLVLSDFMETWNGHVGEMALYHGMTLPMEDMNRLLNFKPGGDFDAEGADAGRSTSITKYSSMKELIREKYGYEAVTYIEQLLRDLNGGVRSGVPMDLIDKGISLFKKSAVMASASVWIQQPSSIARAWSMINPKYFANTKGLDFKNSRENYEELKRYAPIAIVKEMGGFDTGVGQATSDYIMEREYKGGEKLGAFFKDKAYRDHVFGYAASKADQMAWLQLWEACKREQAELHPDMAADSDEVMKLAGERFTDIVAHTQVYDSTLSRSAMMRSKDTTWKMATAFMAEPTTVFNMLVMGTVKLQRGDAKAFRGVVGSVIAATFLNAVLASLVYAARDDDEDKSYPEKYVEALVGESIDSFNPLTLLPIVKDIWSLVQGYNVERTDMAVIADMIDAVNKLKIDENTTGEEIAEKWVNLAVSFSSVFGLPLRNLQRDARAIGNVISNKNKSTWSGVGYAAREGAARQMPFAKLFGVSVNVSDGQQLYEAAVTGNDKQYARVAARFESETAARTALRTALRDNDPRIEEAARARIDADTATYARLVREIVAEGYFSQADVVAAVNSEYKAIMRDIESGVEDNADPDAGDEAIASIYKSADLNAELDAGDWTQAKVIIDDMVAAKIASGKSQKQARAAIKSGVTSYWKPLYLEAYASRNSAELRRIRALLARTRLYGTASEVAETVAGWVKDEAKKKAEAKKIARQGG